jgi:hypothetical protein
LIIETITSTSAATLTVTTTSTAITIIANIANITSIIVAVSIHQPRLQIILSPADLVELFETRNLSPALGGLCVGG